MRRSCLLGILLLAVALPATAFAQAESPSSESLTFFETRIRPILAEHCYECHSGDARKLRGGLRLDRAEHLLRGGETGPVVIPGKPDESPLIKAVRYQSLQMPPARRLAQRDIDLLVQWVRRGAPFPSTPADHAADPDQSATMADRRTNFQLTSRDRAYWAYQPIRRPPIPVVRDAGRVANPIDAFVLSRLEQAELLPNPAASPRELVRRLVFDMTGLPPEVDVIDQFVANPSGEAWIQLIDQQLSRPAYGQRWGRHWLDLVRYAQTNGYERDGEKPYAWRYRDYVIESFNADKPFDQFVVEQLAGDELPAANHEALIATAFYRLGVWDDEPDDPQAARYDGLDDMLSTIGQVFMGQTVGCARCHNHMFDPISQRDYYGLLAFIGDVKPYEKPRFQLDSAILAPLAEPDVLETWRARHAANVAALDVQRQQLAAADEDGRNVIDAKLAALRQEGPAVDWTLAVRDNGGLAQPTHVLIRGNARKPAARVEPGFPEIFAAASPHTPPAGPRASNDSAMVRGRRLALARWIASSANPLTARVIVNRLWQHHFGRGIVASPNDFGRVGTPPTHPQLLDWLAAELIESGWSLRHLHRLILRSNTWRMSSRIESSRIESSRTANDRASRVDPDNRLFWRQNARRLDAEAIRDSVLAVAGQLNLESGGRGFFPRLEGEVVAGQSKPGFGWELSSPAQRRRRSVYSYLKRGLRDPLMETFDFVNTDSPLGVRPTTTVAPQSLLLLNSRFILTHARTLAEQISATAGPDPHDQISALYRRLLGRQPTGQEQTIAAQYLARQEAQFARLANVVTFTPNVPAALYSEYRGTLPAEEFLRGPRTGWSYFPGKWLAGYEAIETVDRRQGPFALCTDLHFVGGTVQGMLRLDRSTERATLLMRARPTSGATWSGVGFSLDPRQGQIVTTIRGAGTASGGADTAHRFATDWRPVAERWLPFQIESTATGIRFQVDTAAPIEVEVPADLIGHFGVAAWGGPIAFDNLRIEPVPAVSSLPHGWNQYGGEWTNAADGTWTVRPAEGAKVVRTHQRIENREVSVDVRLTPGQAVIGGLLLSVQDAKVGADNWHGYEISFDAENQTVVLGDHRNNWTQRQSAPYHVEPGKWHRLHVAINGPWLFVRVDDAPEAIIRYNDPQPLPAGFIGLRTWNSEVAFRNLEIRNGAHVTRVDLRPPRGLAPRDPTPPGRRALVALCQVLMNVNEFVYVD